MIDFCDFRGEDPLYGSRPDWSAAPLLASPDSVVNNLQKWTVVRLETNADQTVITWPFNRMTVNESEGFTPRSFENTVGEVKLRTTVQWKQIDRVYVPVSFTFEEVDGFEPDRKIRTTGTLKWQSVNQPLPPQLLSYEDFPDVQEEVAIFGNR
jgi:hypothetical protein